jgi:hypothetical protein
VATILSSTAALTPIPDCLDGDPTVYKSTEKGDIVRTAFVRCGSGSVQFLRDCNSDFTGCSVFSSKDL